MWDECGGYFFSFVFRGMWFFIKRVENIYFIIIGLEIIDSDIWYYSYNFVEDRNLESIESGIYVVRNKIEYRYDIERDLFCCLFFI